MLMEYLTEILAYIVIGLLIMEFVSFVTRTHPDPATGELGTKITLLPYTIGVTLWPLLTVAAIIRIIWQGRKNR